jgi:endonuclease/exonuclease/phosphatase family metal-dependent hydrolase
MKYLKYPLFLLLAVMVLFGLFLLYGTLSDYRPDEETLLFEQAGASVLTDSVFDLMIWNIGYGGLGHEMDFFYDGGESVRSEEAAVQANLSRVIAFAAGLDSCDFFLFQEVDVNAKRSYHMNQYEALAGGLDGCYPVFGKNYDVFFVPLPPTRPYGRVLSGIVTLGREKPVSSVRHSFPGNYGWPKGTFMLDRCFLVNRYPVSGGRQLLVVNTHLSAYDDGSIRKAQMQHLRGFLLAEYGKGNYIIVGGDWNQTPYGFEPDFRHDLFDTVQLTYVEEGYLPGDWTWLYDPAIPTNRRVATPYDPGKSPTTVIDYFLLSPNILPVEIRGIDLGFVSSDHQPVLAKVLLDPGYNSGRSPASRK